VVVAASSDGDARRTMLGGCAHVARVISPGDSTVNAPDCARSRSCVMTDGLDMSEHMTHRELQDAIARLATKRELEIWSGALIGRMDAQFETLQLHLDAMQRNIEACNETCGERSTHAHRAAELARHTSAIFESTQAMIGRSGSRATG
jgi:hypothetical protein